MTPSSQTHPRIAQVMVLRNEERFLRENLEFHRQIGVSRFYLFLDNCSDRTQQIAETFSEVRIEKVPDFLLNKYYYLSDLQCCCHDRALEYARSENMDWLLGLDPDEFAFAGNSLELFSKIMGAACAATTTETLQKAHLFPMLETLPAECELVSLTTRESIPLLLPPGRHFSHQIYFQGTDPLPRAILNPVTGEEVLWNDVLGHKAGKCLVRTRAEVQAKNPHTWTTYQGAQFPKRPKNHPFPCMKAGHHFHFFIVSPEHWLEKYTKFQPYPTHWNGGKPVEFPKLSWIQTTKNLSREEALDYARKRVFLNEEQAEALVRQGAIVRDETMRDALNPAS